MRLFLKRALPLVLLFSIAVTNISWNLKPTVEFRSETLANRAVSNAVSPNSIVNQADAVYDSLELDLKGLSKEAFDFAMAGWEDLLDKGKLKNDSIITIIDFDQPSYKKRLYVLDVKNNKILFNTWVAHGMNTGKEWAQSFSNHENSHKSSLGFYVTENTYLGSNGFSLKLLGQEKKLNDNAYQRAIVMHGAAYVSQSFINAQGYIGRSHGCPAVPETLNRPIIEKIKNGSCLFIYNKAYKNASRMVQS